MSLDWSVEDCFDYPSLLTGREYALTESLVFSTLVTGMNQITYTNAKEFYTRVKILEGAIGYIGTWADNDSMERFSIKPEDIFARIGMTTNADPATKTKFLNHIYTNVAPRDYDRLIERKRREAGDTFADRLTNYKAKALA
jgi:hypothetical protein